MIPPPASTPMHVAPPPVPPALPCTCRPTASAGSRAARWQRRAVCARSLGAVCRQPKRRLRHHVRWARLAAATSVRAVLLHSLASPQRPAYSADLRLLPPCSAGGRRGAGEGRSQHLGGGGGAVARARKGDEQPRARRHRPRRRAELLGCVQAGGGRCWGVRRQQAGARCMQALQRQLAQQHREVRLTRCAPLAQPRSACPC